MNEYMVACREQLLSRCQYLKKKPAGDEIYYWCNLSDHPCTVEYDNGECAEYDDIKKEWLEEKKSQLALDKTVKTVIQSNKEGRNDKV